MAILSDTVTAEASVVATSRRSISSPVADGCSFYMALEHLITASRLAIDPNCNDPRKFGLFANLPLEVDDLHREAKALSSVEIVLTACRRGTQDRKAMEVFAFLAINDHAVEMGSKKV